MAFQGFGKNTGPIGPPKAQTPFGNFPRCPSPPSTFPPSSRPSETLPKWGYGQKYIYHDYEAPVHQQSPEVVPPLTSVYAESALSASASGSQAQDLRRTGPHTSFSSDAEILGASRTMTGSLPLVAGLLPVVSASSYAWKLIPVISKLSNSIISTKDALDSNKLLPWKAESSEAYRSSLKKNEVSPSFTSKWGFF